MPTKEPVVVPASSVPWLSLEDKGTGRMLEEEPTTVSPRLDMGRVLFMLTLSPLIVALVRRDRITGRLSSYGNFFNRYQKTVEGTTGVYPVWAECVHNWWIKPMRLYDEARREQKMKQKAEEWGKKKKSFT